jgi:hypothetical protein
VQDELTSRELKVLEIIVCPFVWIIGFKRVLLLTPTE